METRIIPFENTTITFTLGENVMVNATEMAKAFGKRPAEWQRLPSTADFLTAYEAMGKSHRSETIRTEVGVGTWFHEDVALEFARWLSPAFAIWCNDRIKELLTTGRTELREKTDTEKIMEGYQLLLGQVTLLEANVRLQTDRAESAEKTIELQRPIVTYAATVMNDPRLIIVDHIAECIGVSAIRLNRWMEEQGWQFKRFRGDYWHLHSEYRSKGWAQPAERIINEGAPNEKKVIQLKWTQAGKKAIIDAWNAHHAKRGENVQAVA